MSFASPYRLSSPCRRSGKSGDRSELLAVGPESPDPNRGRMRVCPPVATAQADFLVTSRSTSRMLLVGFSPYSLLELSDSRTTLLDPGFPLLYSNRVFRYSLLGSYFILLVSTTRYQK